MTDTFLAGLLIGVTLGLLLAPILRWAIAVREWRQASKEARLADEVLRRMVEESRPEPDRARS
jgi:hypothetical protein